MKFLNVLIIGLAIFGLDCLEPANAQPKTGSLIDQSRNKMTGFHDPLRQKTARAAINTIARCKAENNRFRATKTLEFRYLSEDQAKSLNKIYKKVDYGEGQCLFNKRIRYGFSTGPVVGAFSEFFLIRKYGQADIDALAGLTELDWQKDFMKPRNANELFGRCVAQSARNEVYALVQTIPDTDPEAAAIKAIVPYLGPCVTDGLEVSFDKTSLRVLLAFGLYRAVHQHQKMMEAAE